MDDLMKYNIETCVQESPESQGLSRELCVRVRVHARVYVCVQNLNRVGNINMGAYLIPLWIY